MYPIIDKEKTGLKLKKYAKSSRVRYEICSGVPSFVMSTANIQMV